MTHLCTCPGSLAFSLELSRKRNQPAEGSCKTCGGRFLGDGIGPISGTMLGTVGLEVTNSINSELSWKTVTKGKRSRKPVARKNPNGHPKLASKSPKRVGDFSGSDSDKFGETATGQRFPDRVEYVPIKKRRHLLRSPSPPGRAFSDGPESSSPQLPTPSSHSEDLEHLSDHNASSAQHSSGSYSNRRELVAGVGSSVDDGALGDKVSGVTGGEFYSLDDDFSGIALLAAAACINNVDDDIDNAKGDVMEVSSALQGSNTSTSPEPFGESISCSVLENQIRKDLLLLEHKKCSSVADSSVPAGHGSDDNEGCMATRSVSPKVDRRHWDLNTLMEAWEEPHDDVAMGDKLTIEASIDGMEVDKLASESCAAQLDSGNNNNNNNNCENNMPLEPVEKAIEFSESKTQEKKSGDFPCLDGSNAMDKAIESSESKTQEKKSEEFPCLEGSSAGDQDVHLKQFVCKSESLDNFSLAESSHGPGITVSGGTMKVASGCLTVIQSEDGKNVMGSMLLETNEQKVSPPEVPGFEKSGHENDVHMKNAEDCQKTIELPENRTNLNGEYSAGAGNTQDVGNSGSTSGDHNHLSTKCGDLSTSDISVGSQSAVSSDCNGQEERHSSADTRTESTIYPSCREIISEHGDRLVSSRVGEKMSNIQDSGKGSVDDSHKSDVSQGDCGHLDGGENIDELQVDYDSPYEDGELRGSVLCCWEGEDGEHECVDYESDGRGGEDSDAGDFPGSEIVEAGSEGSQGTEKKSLSEIPESDSRKSSGKSSLRKGLSDVKEKIESGGKKPSNQGSHPTDGTSTDMVVVDRSNGSMRRTRSSDRVDALDMKGSYMGDVGLKAVKGKLQSRIEGPSSLHISERSTHHGRSRNIDGSLSRLERDGSPDRLVPRYRSAVQEHDRNGDSRWAYWDSRNRYPSSYRGQENHGQTRSRGVIAGSGDKFGGLNFHDHKQPMSYSSKGTQRQLVRRRSPLDRVDVYGGVHRRIAGISSHRSRGSSGNFSEGIGRVLRDEYGGPVIEDAVASSGRMPHYLSRRDRSFSPPPSRFTQVSAPRRKSRSRSRTRSPRAWQSQRGNLGTRRHSRSPEFRPESRMDRMRVPFQKPNFASDYGESFLSPPRSRFSPQRSYRLVDNRNFVDDHLRHRRSPVGVFRRSQKLDHLGFSGRLKSDEHFRPMGRLGRFPLMDGVGRGCKLEENCDGRRNDERSGMMQRGRHSEAGAVLRRSRLDAEDNFDAGDLNNDDDVRSTDRRDVPRGAREDKRTFKV